MGLRMNIKVTDEYQSQGLIYLRARMFAPSMGRFLTRDTWDGNDYQPLSFNRWNYSYSNPINLTDPSGNFPKQSECLPSDIDYAECLRDWARECLESSNKKNLEFVGNFNLSGYYTPIYEKMSWTGDYKPAKTDPNSPSAINNGDYLAKGGKYTDNEALALHASDEFLNYGKGVCTQGTGIIEGKVILCSTSYPADPKFTWGSFEHDLADLQAFKTVARCGSSRFLSKGDTLYVDAPWYNDILGGNNPEKKLKITDTGNFVPGLCNPPDGNEGIDLYFGEGLSAFNDWEKFQNKKAEEVLTKGIKYWPIYRVVK
jgi:RHS repeat-associated protein